MKMNRWMCFALLIILCSSCSAKEKTVDMAALEQTEEITVPAVAEEGEAKEEWGDWAAPGEKSARELSRRQLSEAEDALSLFPEDEENLDEARQEPELPPISRPMARRIPVDYRQFGYMSEEAKPMGTEAVLAEISKDVAGKVYYQLKEDGADEINAKVAVVIAVPLADFKRETEFGRIVSEYFMTDLADRGIKVTELRLGSEINILPRTGEFIMSRNIGELANNAPELDYIVVSTYSNTRKTLILQGRLVNLKTGVVKTSWRHSMDLNRELLGLFHTSEKPLTIAVRGLSRR